MYWMRKFLIRTMYFHVTAAPYPSFWNLKHWYILCIFSVYCIQSAASDMGLVLHQWSPETGFKGTDWQMCKRPQVILGAWCACLRVSGREEHICTISSAVTTFMDVPFRLLHVLWTHLNSGWTEKQTDQKRLDQRYSKTTATSGIGQAYDVSKYFTSLEILAALAIAETEVVSIQNFLIFF